MIEWLLHLRYHRWGKWLYDGKRKMYARNCNGCMRVQYRRAQKVRFI